MGDELAGLDIDAWVAWAESDEPTQSGVDVFGNEARELGAAVIRRAFACDGSDGRVMRRGWFRCSACPLSSRSIL